MNHPVVTVEHQGGIAHVILNRPRVLNAINPEMALALYHALQQVSVDNNVRCVVLSGAGDGFMAGGDVAYFDQGLSRLRDGDSAELDLMLDHVHGIIKILYDMPQPVVACVHGAVAGFGVSLMMACDLVVAAAGTKFTLAYCHLGTSPDGGATYGLPRMVGKKAAMELALLGDRFDSARALALGLVNWVVSDDEVTATADTLAQRLVAGPSGAYTRTKKLIHNSSHNDLESQLAMEKECFIESATGAEFAEGVDAFVHKRAPKFNL